MSDAVLVLIGAVIAALAGFGGQWLTQRSQSKIAREERRQGGLARKQQYYLGLMERLIEASERYQWWLGEGWEQGAGKPRDTETYRKEGIGEQKHSEIISAAIAACLAAGDPDLTRIAMNNDGNGLCPYQLPSENNGGRDIYSQNRDAILKAIAHMAGLINSTNDVKEELHDTDAYPR